MYGNKPNNPNLRLRDEQICLEMLKLEELSKDAY